MTEERKSLVEKLADVMAEVGYVQKDALNDFHHYDYASAEAITRKVNAALSSRGIAIAGGTELVRFELVDGGKKNLVVVRSDLTFTDGVDTLTVSALGSGIDTGDKATMKANTAANKYVLAKAFQISWGDEPEAESIEMEGAAAKAEHVGTAAARRLVGKMEENGGSTESPFSDADLPKYPTIVANMPGGEAGEKIKAILGVAVVAGWTDEDVMQWAEGLIDRPIWKASPAQADALVARIKTAVQEPRKEAVTT